MKKSEYYSSIGKIVLVDAILELKNVENYQKKQYVRIELREKKAGWIVGYRVIQKAVLNSISDKKEEHIKSTYHALVIFDPKSNPKRVLFFDYKETTEIPKSPYAWPEYVIEELKKNPESYLPERAKNGRFKNG